VSRIRNQLDLAWKEALRRYLPEFLALFKPELHAALDLSQGIEFLDTETRRLRRPVAGAKGQRRTADLVVKVALADGTRAVILLHVEIQAQRDERFDLRMRVYNDRLVDALGLSVYSLAILVDADPEWRSRPYVAQVLDCRATLEFPVIKLLDWRGRREELEASSNPFALIGAATLAALETRPNQPARLERALRIARLLLRRGFSAEEVGGLFYLLEVIMPLNKQLDEVFTREVAELEKRHARQLISPSEQRGRRQGRLEGRVEGRLEGKLEVVRALLESRFGELPEELDRALTAVREPQVLDRLAVQALSLGSVREVLALMVPEDRRSAS